MEVTHVLHLRERAGTNPLSGAETHLWTLLPALVESGVDVELIAVLLGEGDFPICREKLRDLGARGVTVSVLGPRPRLQSLGYRFDVFGSWVELVCQLRKRRKRILHLHLEFKYTPFIAWMAGCRRIVFSLHNDLPIFRDMAGGSRFRLLHAIVRQYIAISEGVRQYFLETSGVGEGRIHTIYYGMNAIRNLEESRSAYGIPEDRFVAGFVGRLTAQKNLLALLTALRERPDIFGVFVGAGPQRAELERFVAEGRMENVIFLGAVPDAQRLMPLFDVLCLPSLWEGLGLVLIEAMLQRVPIIGSNRGAIPDILGEGRHGLICRPTAEGIVEALDHAVENRVALREMAETAATYALGRFTVEKMVAGTMDVYRRL